MVEGTFQVKLPELGMLARGSISSFLLPRTSIQGMEENRTFDHGTDVQVAAGSISQGQSHSAASFVVPAESLRLSGVQQEAAAWYVEGVGLVAELRGNEG